MENDDPPAEQMIHDLGIDPALEIDSDQRAELLRRWHKEFGSRYGKEPDVKGDLGDGDIDSEDNRAELLRGWHQGSSSRYGSEPDVKGDLEGDQ